MPVNLSVPDPLNLHSVKGVCLGVAEAGIKKPGRRDLLVMALDEGARVAAVFTQNRFCAAPVVVAREHLARLSSSPVRALVVNTGCANAGTGAQGIVDARQICAELARLLGCAPQQVLPFSTGVIMEKLPVERIARALPRALSDLKEDHWLVAAQAIMTTDTVPKAVSKRIALDGIGVTVTGIAKGAGMIHPDMATLLAFIATDAPVAQGVLDSLVRVVARRSFNAITVDGDTSTNDAFVLIATGRAGGEEIAVPEDSRYSALEEAVAQVATHLAQAIVRDGEGATKFITVVVEEGRDEAECRKVAYAIARSPLVKTAFFAADPNLGRILAAIGYAGIADLDVTRLKLYLGNVLVAEEGGRAASYREEDGQQVMKEPEVVVRVALGRGKAGATVWTCDLSYDYVRINAEYRS